MSSTFYNYLNDFASISNSMIPEDLFDAIQDVDIDRLAGKDVTKVLPFLAKLLFSPSFVKRQQLLRLIYPIKGMNNVIQLLFAKTIHATEPIVDPSPKCFEASDPSERLRVVASEYVRIQDLARQSNFNSTSNTSSKLIQSDLFDNPIYEDDISYCLYALLIKTTTVTVINMLDMVEALVHLKFGPNHIIRLVANMPDRCQEVCHSLITYGERVDEGMHFNEVSEQRAKTLRMLCLMNPPIALTIRSVTLQLSKMPSLTTLITLDQLAAASHKYSSTLEKTSTHEDSDDQIEEDVMKSVSDARRELEDIYDSTVAFITGILLGIDETTSSWFAQYIKSAQQKRIDHNLHSVLSTLRTSLLEIINIIFPTYPDEEHSHQRGEARKKSDQEKNRTLIRAIATLRLYCALRGIGSMKLNPEECATLLQMITYKPKANQTSVNFATTGVCTLLACSALINNPKEERIAADWLKWLIKESNYNDSKYSSHGRCSISELLLLIAIHFQNNQTSQISELVCATLNMKLQIKASVSKCKSLFVQEVFNDQMVAEHAVKVPVTRNLDDTMTEFLPIHCVHQLLESRSFSKHQVPIKDWIFKQICESKRPLHHMLPKLVVAYVDSVIVSTSVHGHCGTNQPIPDEDIGEVFKTRLYSSQVSLSDENHHSVMKVCDETNGMSSLHLVDIQTAQILLLYYLLLYDDVRLKKNYQLSSIERTKLIKYSPDLMMDIPVFYLLQIVRDNHESYGPILPDLIKLVTSQYPQLCSIQHWLTDEHYEPRAAKEDGRFTVDMKTVTNISLKKSNVDTRLASGDAETLLNQLIHGFDKLGQDNSILTEAIERVLTLPRKDSWIFVDSFICNISKILRWQAKDAIEYVNIMKTTTKLWWRLNTIFPRKLWVLTVNALRRTSNHKLGADNNAFEYSWDELALDPLIVLRCDVEVFRNEYFLAIVLHILNAFLAASRRCLGEQVNEQPNRMKDLRNLEELRTTLILAQTSAAIQILLESCIPSELELRIQNDKDNGLDLEPSEDLLSARFEASVNCICEHLHQVFIAETNLAKLVHFQTYPSELLLTTCDKIPSMHICLDFIPELLSQPDLSKQVFVIELTSRLCDKYAITKSLNAAKLCFNVAYTLLQLLPCERRASFYIPVLPALLRICKVFPILREDAEIILKQINQITLAHMASTSSRLSLGTARPFEGLDKMNWKEVKKLMNSLSSQEALYLCIQKCSIDIKTVDSLDGLWNMSVTQH